jgi:hypothetical protein
MFPEHLISLNGDVQWPALPDLPSWDTSKYVSHRRIVTELKQDIREKVSAIPVKMTQRVMENLHSRVPLCTEGWKSF